jgi:hypothetical protein
MATRFSVQQNNIAELSSDLLLLKHAKGFHGGDLAVANLLTNAGTCTEAEISPHPDDYAIIGGGKAVAPARVMFVGTPHLRDFSYTEMHHFAARAIEILAEERLHLRLMTTTIHGVNYGLDASESLQSLVRGFQEGLARHPECRIEEIVFVEKRERTARILKAALESLHLVPPSAQSSVQGREQLLGNGLESRAQLKSESEERVRERSSQEPVKKHVFVAMPFSEEFQDVYEFGIYEPIRRCGYICERVDEPLFTGDILQRITNRISTAEFVVAELTGAKANVYLEVGYAWGKNIPVITLAREGEKLQFDVSTHRCIFYRTIGQLGRELEKLVREVYSRRRKNSPD